MKTKIHKASALVALGLVIIMMLSFAVSSLPTLIHPAHAWTSGGGYTGLEDPEDINDFDGSMKAMYKYRAWCVFKGLGMDDNQACAALACMEAESGYRPEIVEGSDPLGLGGLGDSKSSATTYIENYCQKMDTDPDFRTDCTDAVLLNGYNIPQDTIDKIHQSPPDWTGSTYSSVTDCTLALHGGYYDDNGVGWLGLGLYPFKSTASVQSVLKSGSVSIF